MAKALATTESRKLVTASARHLHIAPRKMRLVTNLVKNMYALDALVQLQHANKKAAPMVIKLIKSAIANAEHNFSLKPESLYIKSITTDMATVMKRYFPRARGSAFVIRRKMSHVNLELEDRSKSKGKAHAGKTSVFSRTKNEDKPVESIDQKEATNEKPSDEPVKKSQVTKTNEQRKMNTVANKRRLFNRKTGV